MTQPTTLELVEEQRDDALTALALLREEHLELARNHGEKIDRLEDALLESAGLKVDLAAMEVRAITAEDIVRRRNVELRDWRQRGDGWLRGIEDRDAIRRLLGRDL